MSFKNGGASPELETPNIPESGVPFQNPHIYRHKYFYKTHAEVPDHYFKPTPAPWQPIISSLLDVLVLRDVAANMTDAGAKKNLNAGIDKAVSKFIDDYCGTPPIIHWHLPFPWPWPGPDPYLVGLITELAFVANTFKEGPIRNDILKVAARAAEKAYA